MNRPLSLALVLSACLLASSPRPCPAQQFQDQTASRFPVQNEYTNQAGVCDVDGDTDLDIAWANGQGFSSQGTALLARLYLNNGAGVFTDVTVTHMPALIAGQTGWYRGVEFGDCDNDGDWDMVLAQDFNKRPRLLINDGTGHFTDDTVARLPNMTMSSARAQFGDVDHDGDLDLIFCNSGATNRFGAGQPRLFLNDGTGFYTDGTLGRIPAGTVTDQQDIIFGDVDGDFDLDVHLGSRAGQSKLWINNGVGSFKAFNGFPGGTNAYSYDFGDIENDGDLDLLGVNGGSELLLRNDGPNGPWTTISTEISPNTAIDDNDSKFFDFDNDGDFDFIIGSLGSTERVYRNNGPLPTADFTQASGIVPAVGDSTMDIKVADFTGDGRLDIITAQGESGSFQDRIYVNVTGPVDSLPPDFINFEQLPTTCNTTGPYVVRVIIFDSHTSDRGFHDKGVILHYTVDAGADQQVDMDWVGNSLWRGVIPGLPAGGVVAYHVVATDFSNNVGTSDTKTFTVGIPWPLDGDIDGDSDVDDMDLQLLVAVLIGADMEPAHICSSDINGDGSPNGRDIQSFVNILLGP